MGQRLLARVCRLGAAGRGRARDHRQGLRLLHKRTLVNEALPYLVVRDAAFYEVAQEGAELELASGCAMWPRGRSFRHKWPRR